MRQAIYLNKIYIAGIDSHYQMFRQFLLFYRFCFDIFNNVEMYMIIRYDRWGACTNIYLRIDGFMTLSIIAEWLVLQLTLKR